MSKPRLVLLVDDETLFLATMAKVLGRHDLAVHTAPSGEEALKLLQTVDPDAVVLDVKMPGMDGLATLKEIMRLRPLTPVILLTGHGTVEEGQEAVRLGAFDFQTKPVSVGRLLETVEEAIRSRSLAEEAARRSS
jgi:DNA-binding NtrC family response regulator